MSGRTPFRVLASKSKFRGFPVVDAQLGSGSVYFELISRDAMNGVAHDHQNCMVALAGRRVLPIEDIDVGSRIVKLMFNGQRWWTRYVIDSSCYGLTRLFDKQSDEFKANPQLAKGRVIKLNPPTPGVQLGYRAGSSGTDVRGTGQRPPRRPTR